MPNFARNDTYVSLLNNKQYLMKRNSVPKIGKKLSKSLFQLTCTTCNPQYTCFLYSAVPEGSGSGCAVYSAHFAPSKNVYRLVGTDFTYVIFLWELYNGCPKASSQIPKLELYDVTGNWSIRTLQD